MAAYVIGTLHFTAHHEEQWHRVDFLIRSGRLIALTVPSSVLLLSLAGASVPFRI